VSLPGKTNERNWSFLNLDRTLEDIKTDDTVLGQEAGHPAYLATVQFDSNVAHLLVFLDFQNEVMDHGIL
jgi:hypothetical protein